MPYTLGDQTKSVFLNEVESHKLHLEFEVATGATIKAGMPVELASDGTVQPLTTTTAQTTYIGVAIQDRAEGEMVTVGVRGMAVVWADAKEALTPGPVKWDSWNTTSEKNRYTQVTVTAVNMQGWSLDVATGAGDVIRVLAFS